MTDAITAKSVIARYMARFGDGTRTEATWATLKRAKTMFTAGRKDDADIRGWTRTRAAIKGMS
ncbi:hypothetical protein [Mesorhizobium sp.]|uniref:hypothetical protein n=1 Tax=Mesorhizobium sp. TaxID=1871066 RepID=UPI000FEA468C|nr:hypothetical protein [Mesorhizobium sp.]RWO17997.1 MAG: hypothetical protein EOS09_36425 [Mesorhizobium sp.]